MIKYRKVGGLHFLRIMRVQFSWCVCKPSPNMTIYDYAYKYDFPLYIAEILGLIALA